MSGMTHPMDASCIARWAMDETGPTADAADATGNGHTGVWTSNAAAGEAGKFVNARDISSYNGTDERHFTVAHHANLEPAACTYACWYYLPSVPPRSTSALLLGKDTGSPSGVYSTKLGIDVNAGVTRAFAEVAYTVGNTDSLKAMSDPLTVAGWYHWGFTHDGTDFILYQNGAAAANMTASGAAIYYDATTQPLYICGGFGTATGDGLIDDCAIYNEIKSAEWFSGIYNSVDSPGLTLTALAFELRAKRGLAKIGAARRT